MSVETQTRPAEPAPRMPGTNGGGSFAEKVHAIADRAKSLPPPLAKFLNDCRDATLIAPPDKVPDLANQLRRRAAKINSDVAAAYAGGRDGEAIMDMMIRKGYAPADGAILADALSALADALLPERTGVHRG